MDQLIPLDNSPNQSFSASVNVGGKLAPLQFGLRYNEVAKYWAMTIWDASGNLLLDSVPLLTAVYPAANILGQYGYLGIGAAYVVNASGVETPDSPDDSDLGTDFKLVWSDSA